MENEIEIIKLAKHIKGSNKINNNLNILLGTVLQLNPLKIGIYDNAVFLDEEDIYICSRLKENNIVKTTAKIDSYNVGCNATDSNGDTINTLSVNAKNDYNIELTYKDILKMDDKLLLISSDGQTFFVIDKVVI